MNANANARKNPLLQFPGCVQIHTGSEAPPTPPGRTRDTAAARNDQRATQAPPEEGQTIVLRSPTKGPGAMQLATPGTTNGTRLTLHLSESVLQALHAPPRSDIPTGIRIEEQPPTQALYLHQVPPMTIASDKVTGTTLPHNALVGVISARREGSVDQLLQEAHMGIVTTKDHEGKTHLKPVHLTRTNLTEAEKTVVIPGTRQRHFFMDGMEMGHAAMKMVAARATQGEASVRSTLAAIKSSVPDLALAR